MLSGKQIAEARKRKGLTQEALAAELGVSRQTIAKWEQEISIPSVTNAHRLIDILGLQEMENKSSAEDEGNARTICKKRLTKRLLIELWAVYVGIAFLCFFSIGIVALFFIPAISVVLILVAIVVQEVRGKKTDSPMKILLGGICFIGLAILAVVAILASGFVLRENYQHKAFYSVPATQLKKYSAINEWIDECKTIGPDIYWGNINYGSIGSYSHRINFKITALSPTCEFYITSASVEYQQPSVGYVNSGSGITGNKNYDVKTSSYSKAYASFTINGYVNNIYSKILMNSMNTNKITFTICYSLAPID